MVHYAITLGLVFGGLILAQAFFVRKVPAMKAFIEGLARYSTIIGAIVALGGLIGLIFILVSLGVLPLLFAILVLAGCALAVVVGFLLLLNFLRTKKDLPQEKLEQIGAKLSTVQTPIGLLAAAYGLFLLIYTFIA
ncbi:MAG: hypothetical protein HY744_27270 [Deltaproteobacteria bacterium]|nr:hypothetical protein [Deltaproteobacteria bacterium]